jgi:hypothetical protein
MSFGTGFAFREEDLGFGKVYEYRFRTAELVGPSRRSWPGWAGLGARWPSAAFEPPGG